MVRRFLLVLGFALVPTVSLAAVPSAVELVCDVDKSVFVRSARDAASVTFRLWTSETGGSQIGGDYVVPMTDLVIVKSSVQGYDGVRRRSFVTIRSKLAGPVDLGTGEAWLDVSVGTTTLTCDFGLHRNPPLAFPPPARKKLEAVAFARESSHAETCDVCAVAPGAPTAAARLFNSTNFSIASAGPATTLTWDSELFDTGDFHSTTVDTSRLTATESGYYHIFAFMHWNNVGTGSRYVELVRNGNQVIAAQSIAGTSDAFGNYESVSTIYYLEAGQYVECRVWRNSGAPLVLTGTPVGGDPSVFGIAKLP